MLWFIFLREGYVVTQQTNIVESIYLTELLECVKV